MHTITIHCMDCAHILHSPYGLFVTIYNVFKMLDCIIFNNKVSHSAKKSEPTAYMAKS